jgi:hypothetical protein
MISRAPKTHVKKSHTDSEPYTPSCPWIITHTETPGYRKGIITGPNPTRIRETSTINNGRASHVTAGVSGKVAHIDNIGPDIIYVDIFYIISWVFRRDFLYIRRDLCGYRPWAIRGISDEPNGIFANII